MLSLFAEKSRFSKAPYDAGRLGRMQFDSVSAVVQRSDKHGGASSAKYISIIMEELNKVKVLERTPGRMHIISSSKEKS